jgi:DNA replication protein DnaC
MSAGTVNSSATMRFPSATVIDELGFERMSRQEASQFFRLVTYRYGRGSILITTNKSVRDWTELLAGDEVLATAILDRLLHKTHVLNIKDRSYRLRDLEQSLGMQGQSPFPEPRPRRTGCRLNS